MARSKPGGHQIRATGDGRTVRLLLVGGYSLFREAVKAALESEPDLQVVAEAGEGVGGVGYAERLHPDVALLEVDLSGVQSTEATRLIGERVPDCRILVITDQEDHKVLREVVNLGANGYLSKQSPLSVLIEAVRAVARGETVIPDHMLGELLSYLVNRRRTRDDALKRSLRLTRREKQVLALLAEGADNEVVGEALVISPQTARTHIHNILRKLEVHSRLEAAAFVVQNGILEEFEKVS
jgi:two-component system, NarL family, nitrate/nitrite response regulator NarL